MFNTNKRKLFYIDETETEFSSQMSNEKNHPNSFNSKKSFNSLSLKTFQEENDFNKPVRKLTLETGINMNDLVPHPKPLEIHFVPSKLRLNTKGFKDLKCNQQNKILLETNNYYISCPNSEETDSTEEFRAIHLAKGMKKMRKKMSNIKHHIPKVLSKNIVSTSEKKLDMQGFDDDVYSEEENEDDLVLGAFENEISTRGKRINSCSILQILENKAQN